MKIKLRPFTVPNFVTAEKAPGRREDGVSDGATFPLAEVDADALEALAAQFRADLFKKAGKADTELSRPTPSPYHCVNCGGR